MPKPTAIPQPTALPTIAPPPTAASTAGGGGPAAAPARDELADCREFVEIRNTRATIDFYSQLVRVSGDVVVTGGPVRDVAVCIGGSCRPLTGG
jgi:hypothetical protein